jgi:hypothetical protein
MNKVYVVQHVNELDKNDVDIKFIGVYSSYAKAQKSIEILSKKTGFKDNPSGFSIDEYEVDKDNWAEGFITI